MQVCRRILPLYLSSRCLSTHVSSFTHATRPVASISYNKIHQLRHYTTPQIIDSPAQHNINGLNFQHHYMDEDHQKKLLDELYALHEHVWKVKNKEAQPIPGIKYEQFLVKNSDQFGRTVIHIPHIKFMTITNKYLFNDITYIFGHNLKVLADPKPTHPNISTQQSNILLQRLAEQCKSDEPVPNVVQANFYKGPGTGCSMHVDAKSLGKVINMVNLQSEAVMSFLEENGAPDALENYPDQYQILMKPGTLITLRDEARYDWAHGVRYGPQSIKHIGDSPVHQGLRVSIVGFRL